MSGGHDDELMKNNKKAERELTNKFSERRKFWWEGVEAVWRCLTEEIWEILCFVRVTQERRLEMCCWLNLLQKNCTLACRVIRKSPISGMQLQFKKKKRLSHKSFLVSEVEKMFCVESSLFHFLRATKWAWQPSKRSYVTEIIAR